MQGVVCVPEIYIILTRCTLLTYRNIDHSSYSMCIWGIYHTDSVPSTLIDTLTRGEDMLYLPEVYNILTLYAQY